MTKGKKRVAKKDKTDEQTRNEHEMNAIALESQKALTEFCTNVLEKDVHLLWPEQKIDENFAKSFINLGFDLLEHNQAQTKVSDFKEVLFDMLQKCMHKYGG